MRVDSTTEAFARHWWANGDQTVGPNTWLGVPTWQNPFDAWIIQEILVEVRPDYVIETGVLCGGSSLMWASIMAHARGPGEVIAIDVKDATQKASRRRLWKRRVHFIEGSSTDPAVVEEVHRLAAGKRCVVILDSDHTKDHVLAEMDAYADLVPSASYLIVQDGHASTFVPDHGPGPLEAIEEFLARDDRFEIDRSRERMLFTMTPSGYLRRR